MWELIQANKRKSIILFLAMGLCFILLGCFIGRALFPKNGIVIGLFIALTIWFIMSLVSYFSGDTIILAMSGAKEVSHDVHPQLFNIVEEMKIAANLPAMPKIYIIPDPAPNAFATGRSPERSVIAVTAGLLSMLNRDELQGVIAHEMSHVINRDVLFMTFAGVLLGGIVLLSEMFLRYMWYSGGSSRRYRSSKSSKGDGQLQAIIMVVAIVLAILTPIVARLLYFSVSRKREYLADASAARLTRYPEGLASALERISKTNLDLASASKALAPMYIVNPLKEKGRKLSDLTSTHPPLSERIKILRSIAQGVNYLSYQKAFSQVRGKSSPLIPASGLKEAKTIPIRKASIEERKEKGKKKDMRDVGDLMRAVNKYAFLICACGLKMKVPPDFNKPVISCPRCKREMEVPLAQLAAVTAALGAKSGPPAYVRKGKGWESFSCSCGNLLQVSPAFVGRYMECGKCGAKTEINSN